MRLCTAVVDREGTVHGVQDTGYLCARGEGTETACFARRDHSCVTSTPRNETLVRGIGLLRTCFYG